MINSNLGFILHRLVTVHPWRTDEQTNGQSWQQFDRLLKYGRL